MQYRRGLKRYLSTTKVRKQATLLQMRRKAIANQKKQMLRRHPASPSTYHIHSHLRKHPTSHSYLLRSRLKEKCPRQTRKRDTLHVKTRHPPPLRLQPRAFLVKSVGKSSPLCMVWLFTKGECTKRAIKCMTLKYLFIFYKL